MLNGYRGPLFMDSYLVLQSIFSFDQGMSIRLELLVLSCTDCFCSGSFLRWLECTDCGGLLRPEHSLAYLSLV